MKSLIKPYRITFAFIPVVTLALLPIYDRTLDLQLHDTYFVLAKSYVGMLLVLFLLVWSLVYFLARNLKVKKWISYLHLFLSLAFLTYLLIITCYVDYIGGSGGNSHRAVEIRLRNLNYLIGGFVFFLVTQFSYVLVLLVGFGKELLKRK